MLNYVFTTDINVLSKHKRVPLSVRNYKRRWFIGNALCKPALSWNLRQRGYSTSHDGPRSGQIHLISTFDDEFYI